MNVSCQHTLLPAWMLLLELGHIIDILVNDDPQAVRLVVLGYVPCCERLSHAELEMKSVHEGGYGDDT